MSATDLVGRIMAYEAGKMSRTEVREFFQTLIDMEIAWKMHASYGRMARILIERGECTPRQEDSPQLHSLTQEVRLQPSAENKLRILAAIVLTALVLLAALMSVL